MAIANVESDRNELEKTQKFAANFWTLEEDQRIVRILFEASKRALGAGYMKSANYIEVFRPPNPPNPPPAQTSAAYHYGFESMLTL